METLNIAQITTQHPTAYHDQNLALVDEVKDLNELGKELLLEGYVAVIVLNGHAQAAVNGTQNEIATGDIFISKPRNLLERLMVSMDFQIKAIFVTPKYFSTTCKRLTGKTAGTLIDEAILKEATLLLRDSSLSVKQIANRLGFANQSHFGTFFRRKTGISPQQFRTAQ